MSTEVKVPILGESITEATLGQWLKKPGEAVAIDEPIASLETDKVAVEVPSPVAGIMGAYAVEEGATVNVGAVIGSIEAGTAAAAPAKAAASVAPAVTTTAALAAETENSDLPLSPAVRRLVLELGIDPSKIKAEFKEGNYGDYNQINTGTAMIGFDAKIPANTKANFTVTFTEQKQELKLKPNVIVLVSPDPSTGSEGNQTYSDISPIQITDSGDVTPTETPDWTPYGKITVDKALGKTFRFRIDAKAINPEGISDTGIDRSNNGNLGVRGGENTGIEKNEGYLLGLDLTDFDASTSFQLTKIGFSLMDATESCTISNRKPQGKMMVYSGNNTELVRDVKITADRQVKFIDVTNLSVFLNGGMNHKDFLSLFNTSEIGSTFRISGFEFEIK